ncbi:Uncharacterised protein [Kingella potus]|uniref:Uncharacterized protein n=1 Tax=Kingella potus TaxID=265175 RepID=A0A377R3V2_9NEIS|nr:hypothetical protein [Kingella potus]UOO99898.1 hypothetical protein LVJ84_07415 [Kingella potus]STR03156.1 Uncharacterised protein [Kingella potus]
MMILKNLQTKGYEEIICKDGKEHHQLFAIKNNNNRFLTYYSSVRLDKLDQAEDYEIEEINEFATLKSAIRHILSKGAKLENFSVFKGNKPI